MTEEVSGLDADSLELAQGAHHVSVATNAASDSRHGISQHELDMETFKRMQEMIQADPDVPLMMLPQIEYREEVGAIHIDLKLKVARLLISTR